MPLKNIDYSKLIIYKIVSNDMNIKEIYIGSTTSFRHRKSQHKYNCNTVNSENYNAPVYKFIRDNNGWDNWSMIEIEKHSCNDNNEARKRERYFIETLNATLNFQRPIISSDELKQLQYKTKHKEENKQHQKEYRDKNKVSHSMYNKKYREENKDEIKQKYEGFKEISNEKRRLKITCLCGAIISKGSKSAHEKSFNHISKSQSLFSE